MGKSLIIKGADFSINGITGLVTEFRNGYYEGGTGNFSPEGSIVNGAPVSGWVCTNTMQGFAGKVFKVYVSVRCRYRIFANGVVSQEGFLDPGVTNLTQTSDGSLGLNFRTNSPSNPNVDLPVATENQYRQTSVY